MARLTKQQIADNAAAEAATKAAQQAELKRMRAEKRAASKAAKELVDSVNLRAPELDSIQHADISDLLDGLVLPSPKRVLVGFVLGVAAAGAIGYGIGMLLAYALAGIMMLTATAWIAFTLSVLAWIVALYAGWKVGGYVGGKVFASVVMPEGLAARSYESVAQAASSAKQNVVSWFGSSKEKVVEQFNGAHTIVRQAVAS